MGLQKRNAEIIYECLKTGKTMKWQAKNGKEVLGAGTKISACENLKPAVLPELLPPIETTLKNFITTYYHAVLHLKMGHGFSTLMNLQQLVLQFRNHNVSWLLNAAETWVK